MKFMLNHIINGVAVPGWRYERNNGCSALVKVETVDGREDEIKYSICVYPSGVRPVVAFDEAISPYGGLSFEERAIARQKAREARQLANLGFLDEVYLDFILDKYEEKGIDASGIPMVITVEKYYNLNNHKWKTQSISDDIELADASANEERKDKLAYALRESTKLFLLSEDAWIPGELWLGHPWEVFLEQSKNLLFDDWREQEALNLEYLRRVISSVEYV